MTLDAATALNNDKSRIVAGGALNITGQSITNIAAQVAGTESHTGTSYNWGYAGHDGKSTGHGCDCDFYAFKPSAYALNVSLTYDTGITAALAQQAPASAAAVPTRATPPHERSRHAEHSQHQPLPRHSRQQQPCTGRNRPALCQLPHLAQFGLHAAAARH